MGGNKSKPVRPNRTTSLAKKGPQLREIQPRNEPQLKTPSKIQPLRDPYEPPKPALAPPRPLVQTRTLPIRVSTPPNVSINNRMEANNNNNPLLNAMLTEEPQMYFTPQPRYSGLDDRLSTSRQSWAQNAPPFQPPRSQTPPPQYPGPPQFSEPFIRGKPEMGPIGPMHPNSNPNYDSLHQPFMPPMPYDLNPAFKQRIIPNDEYNRTSDNFSTVCQKYRLNMITLE